MIPGGAAASRFFVSATIACGTACGPSTPEPQPKPAGCSLEVYEGANLPPDVTDGSKYWYLRDIETACGTDEPKPACVTRLRDLACAAGAEILYAVTEGASYQGDGTVFGGKLALRRHPGIRVPTSLPKVPAPLRPAPRR